MNVSESLNYAWLNIQTFLVSLARKHTCVLPCDKVTVEAAEDLQHKLTELNARGYPTQNREITVAELPVSAGSALG